MELETADKHIKEQLKAHAETLEHLVHLTLPKRRQKEEREAEQ